MPPIIAQSSSPAPALFPRLHKHRQRLAWMIFKGIPSLTVQQPKQGFGAGGGDGAKAFAGYPRCYKRRSRCWWRASPLKPRCPPPPGARSGFAPLTPPLLLFPTICNQSSQVSCRNKPGSRKYIPHGVVVSMNISNASQALSRVLHSE